MAPQSNGRARGDDEHVALILSVTAPSLIFQPTIVLNELSEAVGRIV